MSLIKITGIQPGNYTGIEFEHVCGVGAFNSIFTEILS